VEGHGNGWFNTGDMGHVDEQGYLFISGRSKEIINRGGETISPFEIEEAIVQHPSVKETIAFSAPHEQYQETVGVIIVTKPGKPRVDLPNLHKYLENKLHRSKWPQVIVYSDGLPKNAAGKTLRIKYAERIRLTSIDEESAPSKRLYEAENPPVGTALTVPIAMKPVEIKLEDTTAFLSSFGFLTEVVVTTMDLASQQEVVVAFVTTETGSSLESSQVQNIQQRCAESLDQYLIPVEIFVLSEFPKTSRGMIDYEALQEVGMQLFSQKSIIQPRNTIESQIELIWRSMLGCSTMLSVTSSFFDLGGDSLKAGQVIGAMRQQLRVPLSVADLFTAPTIEAFAIKISTMKSIGSPQISSAISPIRLKRSNSMSPKDNIVARTEKRRTLGGSLQMKLSTIEEERQEKINREYMTWEFSPPLSSTSFGCLFIQALPIAVIYPLRRIIIWFLIAGPWVSLMKAGYGRFVSLLAAMFIARFLLGLGAPLVGILAKWIIIGKYKAGRYPLWGAMYLKWWIVEQIVNIMGKGYFRDDIPLIGPHLVRLYYILMGGNIGLNVKIHKDAKLGQADLLTIEDDVAIDNCNIRPFSIEEVSYPILFLIILYDAVFSLIPFLRVILYYYQFELGKDLVWESRVLLQQVLIYLLVLVLVPCPLLTKQKQTVIQFIVNIVAHFMNLLQVI
jgi:hypothetical protein